MKSTLTAAAILLGVASLLQPVVAHAQMTTVPRGTDEGVAGAGGPAGTVPNTTTTQPAMRRSPSSISHSGTDTGANSSDGSKASAGAGAR